jgi:hypothetical protein
MQELIVDEAGRARARTELSRNKLASEQSGSDELVTAERSEQSARSGTLDILAASIGLVAIDIILAVRGFPGLYRVVKRWQTRPGLEPGDAMARRICEAVDRACVYYPKRALCLQRSALCTCLLRRKGVAAQMIIAVRKFPFGGHAWVEVNGEVVNDSQNVKKLYSILDRC